MRNITLLASLLLLSLHTNAQSIEGIVQVALPSSSDLTSYQEQGTGILRYSDNSPHVQQALIRGEFDVTDSLTLDVVANVHQDGEKSLGLTQAQLLYKPLSANSIKFKGRAGFFYPKLSLENVDKGWLSPYTYTQSAINSWIGEEFRTLGIETSMFGGGRASRSPWSWEVNAALYKGNDPVGTLISWRGFAMHDRQSLHNDKVLFARYPTVVDPNLLWHPDYVEPFHEIDGKWGYYFGVHLSYFRQASIRYYYFDNKADPTELNEQRLYAWRTRFHSLAAQYDVSSNTRIISQWMRGDSLMGYNFVAIEFDALYMMISHKLDQHRISFRYDRFIVDENDDIPEDINSSDGYGYTLAWRYNVNKNWQIGAEYHYNKNTAGNRITLDLPVNATQNQALAVLQFRW